MTAIFQIDLEAVDHHKAGLKYEGYSAFSDAHNSFAKARKVIKSSLLARTDARSAELQLARVNRDDAFATAREAIETTSSTRLVASARQMIGAELAAFSLFGERVDDLALKAKEYLEAEYGSILSAGFRISEVNEITFRGKETIIPKTGGYINDDDQKRNAWYHLSRGNNLTYRALHAMIVARHELIVGNEQAMLDWHLRGLAQIALAQQYAPDGLEDIRETMIVREPQLLSQRVAVASVACLP